MNAPRITSATTIPTNNAVCCRTRGTANLAMMMMKMNRLSTDREYSVNQPAKNSPPYRGPATANTPNPKATASPMYAARCLVTSLIEGSCGRRPTMKRSTSKSEVVTSTVAHHSHEGTFIQGPRRPRPPGLRDSCPLGPERECESQFLRSECAIHHRIACRVCDLPVDMCAESTRGRVSPRPDVATSGRSSPEPDPGQARVTTTPSSSAQSVCPGTNSTPPKA